MDDAGCLRGFEISNMGISRWGVCRVVRTIPGATVTRTPNGVLSWFREASFCDFTVDGVAFSAEEPYGDNSRYWIGPVPPIAVPAIKVVRDAFAHYKKPFFWI